MSSPFPNINVPPAGFKWSTSAAEKVLKTGQFLYVGGENVTKRALSGYQRAWFGNKPEEHGIVYNVEYRIAGTPENIEGALQYAGFSQQQINQALANAITRDNFQTTMKNVFDQEILSHRAIKETTKIEKGAEGKDNYKWEHILWFADNLDHARIEGGKGAKGTSAPTAKAGRGKSLAARVQDVINHNKQNPNDLKVIDASGMDLVTGTNAKQIKAPKGDKAGKFGSGNIPIVSNDLNKYVKALQLAYGVDAATTYAKEINAVKQALSRKGLISVSPRKSPAKRSPVKRGVAPVMPGATLAAVPSFTTVPRLASPGVRLSPRSTVPMRVSPRASSLPTLGGQGLAQFPPINALGTR